MKSIVKRSSKGTKETTSQPSAVIVIEGSSKGAEEITPRPSAGMERTRPRLAWLSRLSRRSRRTIWIVAAVLVLAVGGGVTYAILHARAASSSQTATLQTATARQGNLVLEASGTGTMMAAQDTYLSFTSGGKLTELDVNLGDQVQAGQLLAQIDDTSQQAQLTQARQTLAQLTSPAALATARQDVAQAQLDLYNAQVARNSLTNWYNEDAYQNALAGYTIAQDNLARAQEMYDQASGNVARARAFQNLYGAKKALANAQFYVNIYSSKPSQRQIDEAQATLDLAQARLTEAQNYLAALTGGTVPEDATGDALAQLNQAEQNVEDAQKAVDDTRLDAPFAGTVMEVNGAVGDTVSNSVIRVANLDALVVQFYMDSEDWSNVKVGYKTNVTFDALPDQVFTGVVTEVYPGLVSVQGSSMVEGLLTLDQSYSDIKLPVGVTAAVDVISAEADNAVLIPVEALHELSAGQYAVFVMENGQPKLRTVEVGLQDLTFAEITSGLQAGEVVTTGIVETSQ
jgi:RND family efflux transporter MFP subunit